jgi:GNAT superfamily N-acetyltransferase
MSPSPVIALDRLAAWLGRRRGNPTGRREKTSEYQLRMLHIFEPTKWLDAPELPSGFQLLSYTPEIEEPWIHLLDASREFGAWDKDVFAREMLRYLVPETAILATCRDRLVACCAAFSMEQYKPYAVLAYPLVLSEYRRRGLGRALILHTLYACQRLRYSGVILHTQAPRRSAILTYLSLGFVPDLTADAEAEMQWHRTLERFKRQDPR